MPPELTQAARLLTDFAADSPDLGCYVQNDNVMGGRSKGGFKLDEPALDPSQITEFGLYIYDNKDGPFKLHLDSVQAYGAAALKPRD